MRIKKQLTIFSIILLVIAFVGTQVTSTVIAKQPDVFHNSEKKFTQIRGELGDASYEILMPDSWNGKLVVACRGYYDSEPPIADTNPLHMLGMIFMTGKALTGPAPDFSHFAYAWSTYGEGGFCPKEGMITTHQLTEYIVENYNVALEVFLIGISMGGEIACLLGEKYPDLYSGVLDVCGVKDVASLWETGMVNKEGIENTCGGTPETKPQAYERWSPTYHAAITIPVISIIGQLDTTVPIQQFDLYYDAVEEAGCLDFYRSYTIPNGGHCDGTTNAAIVPNFLKLIAWVATGDGPDSTDPPIP